ncbi:MAG TPA: hypothetical protein VK939_12515 [Longimicrobiales bacterium]|nr:hypothetical protein [Longimicrobiales bacterium]
MSDVTLFIGTKRGLFIARSVDRRAWRLSEPLLVGREVYHAWLDPRDGRTAWAASDHAVWGPHVHRSEDGGATWEVLESAPHHDDERGLKAVWHLAPGPAAEPATLYAGIEPAGLFVSRDRGASWDGVRALNHHDTRGTWQPAGGALALGSIQLDPRDPRRSYCALSAGGVYRSDDGGLSWAPKNAGVRADFLPDAQPRTGQCVHRLLLHPAQPDRLYQQNHCGVYRSDDRGESWVDITDGLPSGFGYALAVDPADADVAFVVPEESSHMRTTIGGRLRVYRTRDAGGSWEALERGLPQQHAYVSILREGMAHDTRTPVGLYLGTSSGHLFASSDAGESWSVVAGYLPRILSVTAARARSGED